MPDCKHGVYKKSTEVFTSPLNNLFTLRSVIPNRVKMANFAFSRAESKFGWSKTEFSKRLFGSDARGRIGNWKRRGIPPEHDALVASELELTVEELHAAGEIHLEDSEIPPEAVAFARDWYKLSPPLRAQLQALVHLLTMEVGRIDGESVERPELHPRRRA